MSGISPSSLTKAKQSFTFRLSPVLQTEQLDVFLLHRPDPLIEPDAVAEAFALARDSGKVRYFGVSNFSRSQMEFLQQALDAPLVTNQVEISLREL